MIRSLMAFVIGLCFACTLAGCSAQNDDMFQTNDPAAPYNLFKLFDNYPSLNEAIDGLSTLRINSGLTKMMTDGIDMPEFLAMSVDLIQSPFLVPMIGDLTELIGILRDEDPAHYDYPGLDQGGFYEAEGDGGHLSMSERSEEFYGALDTVVTNTELSGDILAIAAEVVNYLATEKTPAEIESTMASMTGVKVYQHCMYDDAAGYAVILRAGTYTTAQLNALGILDKDISSLEVPIGLKITLYDANNWTGNSITLDASDRCLTDNVRSGGDWNDQASSIKVEYDISKLARLLGKVTMSCDYPMWVNTGNIPAVNRDNADTGAYTLNTDLGNSVQGLVMTLHGLNGIAATDLSMRDTIDNILQTDLPALLTALDTATIETLIQNLADHYAPNEIGTNTYETDASYNNTSPYVNASIKETMRDTFPGMVKLFIRDDASGATDNSYVIFKNSNGYSPVEALTVALSQLKNSGIDYSIPGNELEPSLKRMVEYNAYGTPRSSNYPVSALDHMMFTIAMGYNFGYLTYPMAGNSTNGEPYSNSPIGTHGGAYQHGTPTRGILTINDTMYPLTSTGLNTVANIEIMWVGTEILNTWSDTYSLVMAHRVEQGKYVWRSNGSFTTYGGGGSQTGDDVYEFYMGYDYPAQCLLGPGSIGDAGLPNGGQKAITPSSNATTPSTTGSESQNDYRTYFPKAADGKGVLNTGTWMFNWISRACWDGAGPYYYAPSRAGGTDETTSFNWPGKGVRTVNVYYKPNGEVYAYVYKATPNEYYYPASSTTGIGNDVADTDASANGQRFNRYRYIYKSDYYAVQRGHEHGSTSLCGNTVSNANGLAFAIPPMNQAGTSNVAGTTGTNKYSLVARAAGTASQQFWVYEKVQEWTNDDLATNDTGYNIIGNNNRECETQEEALFRNYQWLTLEKKFVFVLPMCLFAKWTVGGGVLGTTDGYLDSAAFVLIEANGLVGLSNARKNPNGMGYWNILNSEGIGNDNASCRNNPDYGNSYRPADSRIVPFAISFSQSIPSGFGITGGSITNGSINASVVYGLLGGGYVLPNIIGDNIAPVQRLGFVTQTGYVPSRGFLTTDEVYSYRNRVLPIFTALAGVMSDGTYYDASSGGSSGYNYNYSASATHKYPLNDFMEGVMIPLSKPMFRHFSANGGRWVPRMEDEDINDYNNNAYGDDYSYFMPKVYTGTRLPDFRPRSSLRTMLSYLEGNNSNATDGLLPKLTDNTGLVTRLLSLLQKLGDDTHATQRTEIFKGLEQVMTAMKINRSENITAGRTFLDYSKYAWMFNKRNEDINMEDFLAYEGPYRATDDWSDFEDFYGLVRNLVGGSRDITPHLVNIVNAVLAQSLTEDQIHGLIYTVGKIMARHNQVYPGGAWNYHGDTADNDALKQILMKMPQMHDLMATGGTGEKYGLMMANMNQLFSDKDSLVYYMMENMTTSYGTEQVVTDIWNFLNWHIISDPNSPLWDDLALLLESMAEMVGHPIDINMLLESYGFEAD